MQRVLSFPMAYRTQEGSAYVTKRVCFSTIFCIAFIGLIGGFMLGKFTSERDYQIKVDKDVIPDADINTPMTELQDVLISISINSRRIDQNNNENILKIEYLKNLLDCHQLPQPAFQGNITKKHQPISGYISDAINLHIVSLVKCFTTVDSYVKQEIYLKLNNKRK